MNGLPPRLMVEPVPLFLAPMAGVTDLAYRLLALESRRDLTFTEFTASGLSRHAKHSWLKVESDPRESPFIPQIFGGDIDEMVQTVKLLQDRADIIDLNFGCPAPVCRNDAGAALLRNPDKVVEMVRACRSGRYPNYCQDAIRNWKRSEHRSGNLSKNRGRRCQRICVHGRTLRQRYSGESDWSPNSRLSRLSIYR